MPLIKIGSKSEDGLAIYAGIVRRENEPDQHVWLLEAKPDGQLNWHDATKWAEEHAASLPTRNEQALLFANLKDQLEHDWHWSGETHEKYSDCAWYQHFINGGQSYSHESYELCVRAVRRSPTE